MDTFYPDHSDSATTGNRVVHLPFPPFSLEAEQSVLGGLMLDNSTWREVADILGPEDFYRHNHQRIFRAIRHLAKNHQPFDLITLGDTLYKEGKLDEAGGLSYLGELARDTPSAANTEAYALIVYEKSMDRQRQAAALRGDWGEIEKLNRAIEARRARGDERYQPITDTELWHKEFEPVRWAVPGLIPEGVTILAGSPKLGKSWLALGVGVAVAAGGVALGSIRVEQGDALYLALEDSRRRLKKRLQSVIPPGYGNPTGRMHFVTAWPRLHAGGAERLDDWLTEHPDTRLVIIDTLEKIRPQTASHDRGQYTADYLIGDRLTPLSQKHNASILLIHHTRKAVCDDPLEQISGTLGLTGGVDGVMVLRRQRGRADAFLYVTGRDIEEEKDYAVEWDAKTTTWTIRGEANRYLGSDERLSIIELLRKHGALNIKEIAERLYPDADITWDSKEYQAAKKLVHRAKTAGKIAQGRFDKRYHLPYEDVCHRD